MTSSKPNKQRKPLYSSDFHRLKKEMRAHLSKELRNKYNMRSIGLIKGDSVKIIYGDNKGKEAKVERVDYKNRRAYLEGVQIQKVAGTYSKTGIFPSKLIITSLELKDKKRKEKLASKAKEGTK